MYWSTAFTINTGVLTYSLLLFLWGVFVGKKSMSGIIEKSAAAGANSPMGASGNNSFSNSISLQFEESKPEVYTRQPARVTPKQLRTINTSNSMTAYRPISYQSTPRLVSTRTNVTFSMEQKPTITPL